jgi:electron transfer flavoprotein beta subunit
MVKLEAPEQDEGTAEILGEGPEAVDRIVEILADDLEVL